MKSWNIHRIQSWWQRISRGQTPYEEVCHRIDAGFAWINHWENRWCLPVCSFGYYRCHLHSCRSLKLRRATVVLNYWNFHRRHRPCRRFCHHHHCHRHCRRCYHCRRYFCCCCCLIVVVFYCCCPYFCSFKYIK